MIGVLNAILPPVIAALRLPFIPVTRVENYCASGTEAFRGAAYAVASGACDIALALGCEKLKDTGYGGLPVAFRGTLNGMWMPAGAIGVTLTESMEMVPEQTTSAIVVHHPQSKYFAV